MVEEIVSLGFKRMELSHGIRLLLVPGILQAIEEGLIEVSSVHNFCPLPGSVQHAAPNLYEPSASDVRERNLWLRYTQQTMAFAVRVGAQPPRAGPSSQPCLPLHLRVLSADLCPVVPTLSCAR